MVIDLHIDLIAIDVVFQTLLANGGADKAVSLSVPLEDRCVQAITPGEVIRQRHSREYTLNVSRRVETRAIGIPPKNADRLKWTDGVRAACSLYCRLDLSLRSRIPQAVHYRGRGVGASCCVGIGITV